MIFGARASISCLSFVYIRCTKVTLPENLLSQAYVPRSKQANDKKVESDQRSGKVYHRRVDSRSKKVRISRPLRWGYQEVGMHHKMLRAGWVCHNWQPSAAIRCRKGNDP